MDMGNKVLESVEDNEGSETRSAADKLGDVDETKVDNNGSCVVENNDNNELLNRTEERRTELNSPSIKVKSQTPQSSGKIKGNGLRKWRRIKRDAIKERHNIVNTGNILPESLPSPGANSSKRMQFSEDTKQKSEGSVSSAFVVDRDLNNFVVVGDSGLVIGPTLFSGMGYDNTEDLSSKSSTEVIGLNSRFEMPKVEGPKQDKIKEMNLIGKNLGNSLLHDQQRKGRINTKKAKGGRVKAEKENSHSSVESDSRSSNFAFMQGTYPGMSNGVVNGSSVDYYGENGDHPSPEVEEERTENAGTAGNHDPLVESISALQSAQEALEKEVEKFKEIGNEDFHFGESIQDLPSECTFVGPQLNQDNSADHLQFGHNGKEARGSKSETISSETISKLIEAAMERKGEAEAALNDLFKRKIETEIEFLILSEAIQKSRFVEQAQKLYRPQDAEETPITHNKKAENLENSCEDIISANETTKLKKHVRKYTACFLVQFVILIIIMGTFISQISPNYIRDVPT